MNLKPEEISSVIKEQIKQYSTKFEVADTGCGIAKEFLESVFEPFEQQDAVIARRYGGSGLGLAITRNAVLMHRGAIKAYSTEGEGTIFTVRIPLNYIA